MKVLVADKDDSVVSLVSTRLKSRRYQVTEVSNSDAVMRHLGRERFDVLLISTQMERIGGKTLIEKIREEGHFSMLPVIMMATEDEIAELLLSHERGFDDFLIKPFDPLVLQLRVALCISRIKVRRDANALTHLPGNSAIEQTIRRKLEKQEKFSVLYIDINQFKSFNDKYGFEKGDNVIRQTGKILLDVKKQICGEDDCFVGHIGGDDFVAVLSPDKEESFAKLFIGEFDRIIPTYYNTIDQKRGSIEVINRKGKREVFPLMSCAVAACTNLYRPYKSFGEIARDAADLKSFLKSQPGSQYLRDRRSAQIENLDQVRQVLGSSLPKVQTKTQKIETGASIDPLGKILLSAGLIDEEQLARAIKRHMLTGQRLGQTLIAMNLVRSEDVGKMLEKKLNVPYVSLRKFTPSREVLRLFSFEFLKSHRVCPLEIAGDNLKLAMCDPFDIKTLDSIERISTLKPVPCLALEDEFEEFIEAHSKDRSQEQMAG